jgi:hypothetical protein
MLHHAGEIRRRVHPVLHIDEGIQPQVGMTLGVRQRCHVFLGLDEDLPSVAADDGEKRVSIRLLESGLKAQTVAVKGDGLIDISDDEDGEIAGIVGRVISVWTEDSQSNCYTLQQAILWNSLP